MEVTQSADTKWKLFDCVLQNIRENSDFAEQLDSAFALDDSKIRKELAEKELLSHGVLVSLFGLSIGKWLLKMMTDASPRLKVRLLKSYSYRVRINEPDMLSLAFIFEPITSPAVDRSGLSRPSKNTTPPPSPTETEVCAIADVDELLKADTALHDSITDAFGDLLATVHYDKARYLQWVADEGWKSKKQKKAQS